MNEEKRMLDELIEEIKALIDQNENPDGTFKFDFFRAKVALEFAKVEISKSISSEVSQHIDY